MQRPAAHEGVFRPNSAGFYATIGAFLTLCVVAGNAIWADRASGVVWLLVVAVSCILTFALASVRISVAPSRILVSCLGVSRVFPTALIDPRRCDDFAQLGMFQLALRNGHFVLIPRAAFADAALFTAIETVLTISAAPNLDGNRSVQT
jgi:hypothetical protein